ncbi:glycosyltransferase [Ramlibacter monticola]|uniref:Glycosyltransferase n=1 Tax=Ramlibacter monticola TaxID=1926872 RepID=A0A936YXQ3_9BURK|nr:glycosyltransferase [Ramlibacter monticola]
MKRILIYSHDTFGLGNVRRMLEIARHLVASSPEITVLLLTGSPMLHAFRIPPRIDYVKLPCLARDTTGRYGARSLAVDLPELVRLRANLIKSATLDFAPDLVLVDKKPFGVQDELAGVLEMLSRVAHRPRFVLLLRDILDSAEATRSVWQKNGYYEAVDTYYDEVLVVGSPEIFDLRREYAFPPFAAAKVRFCGYIAREAAKRSRAHVRAALGVDPHEPMLLVTPGGGEDGFRLVATALEGLARTPAHRRPRTHVVCGPEMPEHHRTAVESAAADLPQVSVEAFSDDMMSLIGSADVAVTMGGYNTVCELLTSGRRGVIVPRCEPGVEQLLRAERMAERGLLRMVSPDALSPSALMAEVQHQFDALARSEPLPRLKAMNGLDKVSRALRTLVDLEEQRTTSPMRIRSRRAGEIVFTVA